MSGKQNNIVWLSGFGPRLRRVRYSFLMPIDKTLARSECFEPGMKLYSYKCLFNERPVLLAFLDGKNRFNKTEDEK
jgi:hypothetical protein